MNKDLVITKIKCYLKSEGVKLDDFTIQKREGNKILVSADEMCYSFEIDYRNNLVLLDEFYLYLI